MKNRVFRCIEHRARGFVGLLVGELISGFSVSAMMLVLGHPLVGLAIGSGIAALLAAWRRRDADRGDYATVRLKRLLVKNGHYRVGG